jgi:hypothetical protein
MSIFLTGRRAATTTLAQIHAYDLNLCTDLHCSRRALTLAAPRSCPATPSTNALMGVGCHQPVRLPRANPHSARGTTACHFPRFRSLKAFGRRPRCTPRRRDRPASETLNIQRHVEVSGRCLLLHPIADSGRVYEYTPSPADPKAPQSRALHKLGVGAGMKFPASPKNKPRSVFGLERIKIRENTLKPPWTLSLPQRMIPATADCGAPYGHCGLAAEPGPREV